MCDLFVSFSYFTISKEFPSFFLTQHPPSPPPRKESLKCSVFSVFSHVKGWQLLDMGGWAGTGGRASTRKRAAASVRITTQDKNKRGKQEERTDVIVWNLARDVFLSTVLLPPRQDLQKGAKYGVCKASRKDDSQCRSRNWPGFDPSILWHSEIWGAADGSVLNIVWKKKKSKKIPL
jgi:hypothetical protein